jgi:dihydroxyacetone kinase
MDIKVLSLALISFADQHKTMWNELDAAQGDGDLGITMVLAAGAMEESARSSNSIQAWFQNGGKSLRKAAPSTMGILMASALISASKVIPDEKRLTLQDWATVQQTMISEIQSRGGAQLGDKTVLDALIPAAATFAHAVQEGKSAHESLAAAAKAAEVGAKHTATLLAKTGRSSWLGERTLGKIDGGAWACFQLYDFLAEYADSK